MRYYILCIAKYAYTKSWCFLRVRGGVSTRPLSRSPFPPFSPRTRRCFLVVLELLRYTQVFSAYAEVFLKRHIIGKTDHSFLRVRGGVSYTKNESKAIQQFSPRTRRCFYLACLWCDDYSVFSAYAEVFLYKLRFFSRFSGFLRVRGGVSL